MKGKFFVIEGLDGSGKETQTNLLLEALSQRKDLTIKKLSYPCYDSESSTLVKMYLRGEFGESASAVNPYAASLFFAVDRYASFKKDWETFLDEKSHVVIADRYTMSNMIHQAAKIENPQERQSYLQWLYDLEFNKMGLPIPTQTFFLDVPPHVSQSLMAERANKFTKEQQKDIHERDVHYLAIAHENSLQIAHQYGWEVISCTVKNEMRLITKIHEDILKRIKTYF